VNGEIAAKLREMERYVQMLKDYQKSTIRQLKSDMTLRGAVERYMQLAIEIVVETGEMIIARQGFKKPETYREVIEILGENKVIDSGFAKKFAPAAGFRNILVHRYGSIQIEELYEHLQRDVKDFDTFAKQVAEYLKRKKF
jgi:uncharacterized protein YutE (UPF0331/DUF86 family)